MDEYLEICDLVIDSLEEGFHSTKLGTKMGVFNFDEMFQRLGFIPSF